jgi:cell division protein FtsN
LVENNIQILNGWDANEKEAGGSVSANSVQGGGFAGGTSIEFGISGKPAPIPAAKPVHELPVPAEKPHVTVTLKPAENAAGPQSTVNVYVPPPQAKDGEYYPGGAGGFPRGPLKAPRYTAPEKGYWVQLGSYIELARAQRAAAPILANGVSNLEIFAKEINGSMYYRIKMGPYLSRAEADGALIRLGRLSLPITEGFIVRD